MLTRRTKNFSKEIKLGIIFLIRVECKCEFSFIFVLIFFFTVLVNISFQNKHTFIFINFIYFIDFTAIVSFCFFLLQICEELSDWELQLDRKLVNFQGRVLPPEKIIQGNNVSYIAQNVDWTNNLRSNPLLVSGTLDHWAVVTLKKFSRETSQFLDMINRAARGMNFRVGNPKV